MSRPTIAGQPFPGDDGSADPAAAAALAAFASGRASEHAALVALAGCRLLVPVVAVLTGAEDTPATAAAPPRGQDRPGAPACPEPPRTPRARTRRARETRREKTSEMALPTLVGHDGRHAVLAFTSAAALAAWRPDARPVLTPASRVWQAGAHEADAVVIDVAGPVPLTVEGARLAALAEGRPAPAPHEDPDLLAAAQTAAASEPQVARVRLLPGGENSDLAVELTLRSRGRGKADVAPAIRGIAAGIAACSGDRLRRGIAFRLVEG